jgi:hypothetical protein
MSVRGEFAAIVRTADIVAIASGPHFCYVVCPLHVGVRITKEDQDGKVYCVHELHGGARGDGQRQHELDYGSLKERCRQWSKSDGGDIAVSPTHLHIAVRWPPGKIGGRRHRRLLRPSAHRREVAAR